MRAPFYRFYRFCALLQPKHSPVVAFNCYPECNATTGEVWVCRNRRLFFFFFLHFCNRVHPLPHLDQMSSYPFSVCYLKASWETKNSQTNEEADADLGESRFRFGVLPVFKYEGGIFFSFKINCRKYSRCWESFMGIIPRCTYNVIVVQIT